MNLVPTRHCQARNWQMSFQLFQDMQGRQTWWIKLHQAVDIMLLVLFSLISKFFEKPSQLEDSVHDELNKFFNCVSGLICFLQRDCDLFSIDFLKYGK